jgi:hypothetical protein
MPLPGELRTLRDRALGELGAVEEYFRDAEQLWRLAGVLAVAGTAAGPALFDAKLFGGPPPAATVVEQARPELVRLAGRAQGYVAGYLAEATFLQALDLFEAFVSDLLTVWLTAHPDRLGDRDVKLFRFLQGGVETVIADEVKTIVYATMKDGPRHWFQTWEHHTGLVGPPADQVSRLVEAKGTRDLLVHGRGTINPVYLKKAGKLARGVVGDRIDIPEPYRREVWELLRQLVTDLSDAALAKLAPDLPPPPAGG